MEGGWRKRKRRKCCSRWSWRETERPLRDKEGIEKCENWERRKWRGIEMGLGGEAEVKLVEVEWSFELPALFTVFVSPAVLYVSLMVGLYRSVGGVELFVFSTVSTYY